MQEHWRGIKTSVYLSALMILILDSSTALEGARIGLELCMKSAIPALFPAMTCSEMLIQASWSNTSKASSLFQKLKLPTYARKYYICGILGGYPIGARLIGEDYKCNQILKSEAENALLFCNNAGPAFIFGICSVNFTQEYIPAALWIIQILSSIIVGIWLTRSARKVVSSSTKARKSVSFNAVVKNCVKSMGHICGWITLFRVVLHFFQKWFLWLLPSEASCAISGVFELTNGVLQLQNITDWRLRFVLCSVLLSLGGLCVTMQTATVINGLSLANYMKGKISQGFISALLSVLFVAAVIILKKNM